MSYLILIINSLLSINSALLLISLFILIFLLIGKIAPKIGFITIFLISLLNYSLHKQPIEVTEQPSKQPLLAKDTQVIINTPSEPEAYSAPIPLISQPNKVKVKKEIPQYITKVQLEGVSNKLFLQKFEAKSGYTIAKKGDYLITFSHSGSTKKGNRQDGSRWVYSGGHLVVKVGENNCCCSGVIPIPKIPLGKSMKEGRKIMLEKVDEYALKNIDIIIPMIVECLPKI